MTSVGVSTVDRYEHARLYMQIARHTIPFVRLTRCIRFDLPSLAGHDTANLTKTIRRV
jgi:hypothetical protein